MSPDRIVNRIAHITGNSRKQVIDVLKSMGVLYSNQKSFHKTYDQKRRKMAT